MSNIVPNTDGKISVLSIDLLWKEQVGQGCLDIFSHKGEATPELTKLVSDTRAGLQKVNGYIAKILADFPE